MGGTGKSLQPQASVAECNAPFWWEQGTQSKPWSWGVRGKRRLCWELGGKVHSCIRLKKTLVTFFLCPEVQGHEIQTSGRSCLAEQISKQHKIQAMEQLFITSKLGGRWTDRKKIETETRMEGVRAQPLEAFHQCHCIMGCNWLIYYHIIIIYLFLQRLTTKWLPWDSERLHSNFELGNNITVGQGNSWGWTECVLHYETARSPRRERRLWFGCEMFPTSSYAWTVGPQ